MPTRIERKAPVLLAACLATSVLTVAAVHREPAFVISLKSRVFTPSAGVEAALLKRLGSAGPPLHVIVQFRTMPTPAQRTALRASGVRLLDPLTGRAFFAAMPRNAELARTLARSPDGIARSIALIQPADKLAPGLLADGAPAYARDSAGRAILILQFFGDTPVDTQRAILTRHGSVDSRRIDFLTGWVIALPPDSVRALAADDPVQWIASTSGNPEPDNDGVRGVLGVNADALLAAPYNLSGEGVTVGLWDFSPASLTHVDYASRITLADPPLPPWARTQAHDKTVADNGRFDAGEGIYRDVNDSEKVDEGDIRETTIVVTSGGTAISYPVGTTVASGDGDIGRDLALFNVGPPTTTEPAELYVDRDCNARYTAGEPIYRDLDADGVADAGELVSGVPASTSCPALQRIPTSPHGHGTLLAGTIAGDGGGSSAAGGLPNQWKGVAPKAKLRAYSVCSDVDCASTPWPSSSGWFGPVADDHLDAGNNGVTIAAHPWGPARGHCHQFPAGDGCYDELSQMYDGVSSGRNSDGTATGHARLLVVASAGNAGIPERHTENVAVNGKYDSGEAIYVDSAADGVVSVNDVKLLGPAQAVSSALIDFAENERHTTVTTSSADPGAFEAAESVYRDNDNSGTVSSFDALLAGGGVVSGTLRHFRRWRTLRVGNSAKNTIQLGAVATDDPAGIPAYSSRGPTGDGRTKPDLVAAGARVGGDHGVKSTYPRNQYRVTYGTSVSTAAAAGSAALLTEWYRHACTVTGPTPEVTKALLIHGASDVVAPALGAFAGPDFATGFGRLRVKEAADLVPHHLVGNMAAPGNVDVQVTVAWRRELRVTLVWNDPPRAPNVLPPAHETLVNDLDLVLIAPNGRKYTPWLLDPTRPTRPATHGPGPDYRNPVEQVVVGRAAPGTWTIRVSATPDQLKLPEQSYVLVSEVLSPATSPCAGPTADVWIADNAADAGVEPSSGVLHLAPGLWNRHAADALPAHQRPLVLAENFLYAAVGNRGANTAAASTLELYVGDAATGAIWPTSFFSLGSILVPNLLPGEVRQVGPLSWNPPMIPWPARGCLYARLVSAQDPITIAEGPNIDTNARHSNNIAYRAVNALPSGMLHPRAPRPCG